MSKQEKIARRLHKKTWIILTEMNPDFGTGEEYPSRLDFFRAKAILLERSLSRFEQEFSEVISELHQTVNDLKSKVAR